jgi:hypothetical protein
LLGRASDAVAAAGAGGKMFGGAALRGMPQSRLDKSPVRGFFAVVRMSLRARIITVVMIMIRLESGRRRVAD